MSASNVPSVRALGETSKTTSHKGTGLPPLTSQFPKWSRGKKLDFDVYQAPLSLDSTEHQVPHDSSDRKVSKKSQELAAMTRGDGVVVASSSDPVLRITYLEQNIRFLQEQHQIMLSSLHHEIELLKLRNRELQFQLVFSKSGMTLIQSSPSSPEDDSKPKIILSPKQINTTPLQVEILEKEIAELKVALEETKIKNSHLSEIIEDQRKQSNIEKQKVIEAVGDKIIPAPKQDAQNQAGCMPASVTAKAERSSDETELVLKLEEAEQLIRKLRRENEDQRRELAAVKSNLNKSLGGAGRQQGTSGSSHRVGNHHRPLPAQRFPPLHTHNYWHHGQNTQQHRNGVEYVSHRYGPSGGSRADKEAHVVGRPAPTLPNLRNNTPSGYSYSNSNGNSHRRNVHYNANGNNHYYRSSKEEGGETRRYRGGSGRGSRDPRQSEQ